MSKTDFDECTNCKELGFVINGLKHIPDELGQKRAAFVRLRQMSEDLQTEAQLIAADGCRYLLKASQNADTDPNILGEFLYDSRWLDDIESAAIGMTEFAERLIDSQSPATESQLLQAATDPEYVFRPDGNSYDIKAFGESGQVTAKLATGLHILYRLVQTPSVSVPMLELDAGPGTRRLEGDSQSMQPIAGHKELQDIASERQRLQADLDEIDGERERNEVPSAESEVARGELQSKLDVLDEHVKALTGLGGKARDLNNPIEKLRPKIAGRLRTALEALAETHPLTAEHFQLTCSAAGASYIYAPGSAGIRWATETKQ